MKHQGLSLVKKNHGQVAVEYVLLLVASVTIATVITKLMVSRDPDHSGFLVDKWYQIQKTIGDDLNR